MGKEQRTNAMYQDHPTSTFNTLYVLKWTMAMLGGIFIKAPGPVQTLVILMVMDYLLGFLVARRNRTWCPEQGLWGLVRKFAAGAVLLALWLLCQAGGLSINIGNWGALAMGVNEVASIMRNARALGVEIPLGFVMALDKARKMFAENNDDGTIDHAERKRASRKKVK